MNIPGLLGGMSEAVAAAGLSRHPSVIARDPNSTPQELLDVARWQPEAVLENPSLPLLMVSDQRYWQAITHFCRQQIVSTDLGQMRSTLPQRLWEHVEALAIARARPLLLEVLPELRREPAGRCIDYLARWPREGLVPALGGLGTIDTRAVGGGEFALSPELQAEQVLNVALEAAKQPNRLGSGLYGAALGDLVRLRTSVVSWARGSATDVLEAELLEKEAQLRDAEALLGAEHGLPRLKWWQVDDVTGKPKP